MVSPEGVQEGLKILREVSLREVLQEPLRVILGLRICVDTSVGVLPDIPRPSLSTPILSTTPGLSSGHRVY